MAEMDHFLALAVERGASDLHMSTGVRPMLRIHGEMTAAAESVAPLTAERITELMGDIVPGRNREELHASGDTDFAYELEGHARFRVNLVEFPTCNNT